MFDTDKTPDFEFEGNLEDETEAASFSLTFKNGITVKVMPEDFTNPWPRVQAYVSNANTASLHLRAEDIPCNREMYAEDLLTLLNWCAVQEAVSA